MVPRSDNANAGGTDSGSDARRRAGHAALQRAASAGSPGDRDRLDAAADAASGATAETSRAMEVCKTCSQWETCCWVKNHDTQDQTFLGLQHTEHIRSHQVSRGWTQECSRRKAPTACNIRGTQALLLSSQ